MLAGFHGQAHASTDKLPDSYGSVATARQNMRTSTRKHGEAGLSAMVLKPMLVGSQRQAHASTDKLAMAL